MMTAKLYPAPARGVKTGRLETGVTGFLAAKLPFFDPLSQFCRDSSTVGVHVGRSGGTVRRLDGEAALAGFLRYPSSHGYLTQRARGSAVVVGCPARADRYTVDSW